MNRIYIWNYVYNKNKIQVKDISTKETSFTNGCHKQELYVNDKLQDIAYFSEYGTRMTGSLPNGENIKVISGIEDDFQIKCYLFVNNQEQEVLTEMN